jgi:hypothetical protein
VVTVNNYRQRFEGWLKRRSAPRALADGQTLPAKDLFERFSKLRDSTRWSAAYLFFAAALLLAWSRSPTWGFQIPLGLLVQGDKPLALQSATAPIFGPIIILFFYVRLYTLHRETLSVGTVLASRLRWSTLEKTMLEPPFDLRRCRSIERVLFFGLVLFGTACLTIWLLVDFFLMEHHGERLCRSLFNICDFWGVVPTHFDHSAGVTVFGFAQSWIYIALTLFDLWMLGMVLIDTLSYMLRLSEEAG